MRGWLIHLSTVRKVVPRVSVFNAPTSHRKKNTSSSGGAFGKPVDELPDRPRLPLVMADANELNAGVEIPADQHDACPRLQHRRTGEPKIIFRVDDHAHAFCVLASPNLATAECHIRSPTLRSTVASGRESVSPVSATPTVTKPCFGELRCCFRNGAAPIFLEAGDRKTSEMSRHFECHQSFAMRVFFVYALCLIPAPQPILCLSRTGWIGQAERGWKRFLGIG